MTEDKPKSSRRVLLSMKQYLVLKTIAEMGGKDIYYSQIVSEMNNQVTWAHAVRILNEFERIGVIRTTKKGRVRVIELTDKGKHLLELIEEILDILKPTEKKEK